MHMIRRFMLLVVAVCVSGALAGAPTAAATAPEASHILLYPGQHTAYINGVKTSTEADILSRNGRYFLPASELTRWLGVPVTWNEPKGVVQMTTPQAFLEFALSAKTLRVNGAEQAWGDAAFISEDRLYLALDWLGSYISLRSRFNEDLQRLELVVIKSGDSTLFRNDTLPNVKPVAKFVVDKDAYRIGEPIRYTNLSYDPQGEALTDVRWTGNAEAIFTPGLYKVSLQVADSDGNVSDTFSHNVLVKDEPYLSEFEYSIYHKPVGTFVKEEESVLRKHLRGIPQVPKTVRIEEDRPLIVSDSPETFTRKGVLYQEKINGKARLYADHVNGTGSKMKFAIAMRNPSADKAVTIHTTNYGEVYPSIYANLIGNEATIEFLQGAKPTETMVLGPNETAYYKVMPNFYPDQGMNVFYDVESSGEAYVSFLAMEEKDTLASADYYPLLPYSGNVRGTFTSSQVSWELDAAGISTLSSFAIGDGTSDPFVTGKDFISQEASTNLGNYGVVYNMRIKQPKRMAVLILPRGGPFKGPFMVNGRIVQTPPSGMMMDYQGYTIIARTDGTEPYLDIDFSPAAGSAFPIDIILYPLADK